MTTQTVDRSIGEYVGRCVEYLRDLGENERASILDDIRQILSEVTAELEGAPDDLLGPPELFVAELRAAARLQHDAPPPRKRATANLAWLRAWRTKLQDLSATVPWRPVWDWLRTLAVDVRPGWWVLRGFLAAAIVASWPTYGVPLPLVFGSRFLGLVTVIGSVVGSVYLGRRRFGRRRWAGLAITLLGVWGLIIAAGGIGAQYVEPTYQEIQYLPTTTYYEGIADPTGFGLVAITISTPLTQDFQVVGPAGAEEVLAVLFGMDIGVDQIWVDFGAGPNSFTSEGQLREMLRAFWSDSN